MRIRPAIGASAALGAFLASPAAAQERGRTEAASPAAYASLDAASGPGSPSNATSTVSPTSVPQAMERLADRDATADVSLGSIYAQGDFGARSKTTIWSAALGARVRLGDWKLTASLPWMRIRSRSTVFTGVDSTPVLVAPDTSPTKRVARGVGDLTLGVGYTIAPAGSKVEVELSGRAKLNTASNSSRLSSGKNDYALGAEVSAPMGRLTPFATFTYRFLGDTRLYDLRDGPAASAGASYAVGADTFVLASYHYSRGATRLVGDAHELFAGASARIPGSRLRVTGFTTAGLSRGAADVSAGVALSIGFRSRRDRI